MDLEPKWNSDLPKYFFTFRESTPVDFLVTTDNNTFDLVSYEYYPKIIPELSALLTVALHAVKSLRIRSLEDGTLHYLINTHGIVNCV